VAREIIGKALEIGATVIVMEDLEIYKEERGLKELNGRLRRWKVPENIGVSGEASWIKREVC